MGLSVARGLVGELLMNEYIEMAINTREEVTTVALQRVKNAIDKSCSWIVSVDVCRRTITVC